MPAIPATQLPVEFENKRYSGVFSVSGTLMIVRIPGVGSKSAELSGADDPRITAKQLMLTLLNEARAQGLPF